MTEVRFHERLWLTPRRMRRGRVIASIGFDGCCEEGALVEKIQEQFGDDVLSKYRDDTRDLPGHLTVREFNSGEHRSFPSQIKVEALDCLR
jgi:hypothetical protein